MTVLETAPFRLSDQPLKSELLAKYFRGFGDATSLRILELLPLRDDRVKELLMPRHPHAHCRRSRPSYEAPLPRLPELLRERGMGRTSSFAEYVCRPLHGFLAREQRSTVTTEHA